MVTQKMLSTHLEKKCLFGEKNSVFDWPRSNQLPETDQKSTGYLAVPISSIESKTNIRRNPSYNIIFFFQTSTIRKNIEEKVPIPC